MTLGSSAPWLRLADGRVWRYRYASALDLLGHDPNEYLDWAQATSFTGVRVLTTASITMTLPPDVGLACLPRLFDALRARGMGAELVALADTRPQGMDRAAMRAHVAAVGSLAAGAGLPLSIELANENGHPTQQADLTDVSFLRELRSLIPSSIPVSMGCWGDDTTDAYPGGDYSTVHLDRSRETFAEVARIKHLFEWPARRFVVNDESIGAAEVDKPGSRCANPSRYFAQGLLDRLGDLGSTFHFDLGVPARVPGPSEPVQNACAEAFIAGHALVGDDSVFRFVNDSAGDGITHGADWSHVFKLFGFINQSGGPSLVVALGVTGAYAPTFANGWHQVRVAASWPGVQVLEVAR